MPPPTVQALIIILIAVLPGACYVWAFERQAGAYGVGAADRTLRLLAASVAIHLLLSPFVYLFWRLIFKDESFDSLQFIVAWIGMLVATGLPYAAGTCLGVLWNSYGAPERNQALRGLLHLDAAKEGRLLTAMVGKTRAPTAWDALFSASPSAVVRVRTKSSGTILGVFGQESYAGAFPNARDLLLQDTWSVEPSGSFGARRGVAVLLPAEEIVALELKPVEGTS